MRVNTPERDNTDYGRSYTIMLFMQPEFEVGVTVTPSEDLWNNLMFILETELIFDSKITYKSGPYSDIDEEYIVTEYKLLHTQYSNNRNILKFPTGDGFIL